ERWKTRKKRSSTAIWPRFTDAIWRLWLGASHHHVASILCLAVSAAARRGDGGVLSVADGAAGCRGRRRAARIDRISRDPDRAALPRDPDQYGRAVGGDYDRHAYRCDDRGDVSTAPSLSRPDRADRDADLSAGVSRRRRRIPDYPAGRTSGADRRHLEPH